MGEQFYRFGKSTAAGFENRNDLTRDKSGSSNNSSRNPKGSDEDLVIEENTVYEIDRECYERLKKQRKR
jgi:hypothetical protein